MECPICYNQIINSSIGSCTHHFCTDCIIRWCEFGGTTCPTCKTLISEIRPDKEFDYINNQFNELNEINSPKNLRVYMGNSENIIVVNFEKNDLAGITLENNCSILGNRGPGVIIKKINENYKCFKSGLRKHDILLSINNIPCIDHKQSIDIINQCAIATSKVICKTLKVNIK